jgi:hypothetical protein
MHRRQIERIGSELRQSVHGIAVLVIGKGPEIHTVSGYEVTLFVGSIGPHRLQGISQFYERLDVEYRTGRRDSGADVLTQLDSTGLAP